MHLIVTDHSFDRVCCVEYLTASYTACAVECTAKCLSTDTYENGSKLSSDLMLLVSRENVDDTVDS